MRYVEELTVRERVAIVATELAASRDAAQEKTT
jgi:hypothetical protein